MRQKVLRSIVYKGRVIEKIQDERFRSGVPFRPANGYYAKEVFYWVPSMETDFDLLREAKSAIETSDPSTVPDHRADGRAGVAQPIKREEA